MSLTYPANISGIWQRIWNRQQPEIALDLNASEIGFPNQTIKQFNFFNGIAGIGGYAAQLINFEEGLYELTWSISYVSGGVADQQMAFGVFIRDGANQPVWGLFLAFTTGQNITYRVRRAIRQGHGMFVANQQATTLAGTFAVTAMTADLVVS